MEDEFEDSFTNELGESSASSKKSHCITGLVDEE
jgi:hypothetical protein